jgi:hypothetical protein
MLLATGARAIVNRALPHLSPEMQKRYQQLLLMRSDLTAAAGVEEEVLDASSTKRLLTVLENHGVATHLQPLILPPSDLAKVAKELVTRANAKAQGRTGKDMPAAARAMYGEALATHYASFPATALPHNTLRQVISAISDDLPVPRNIETLPFSQMAKREILALNAVFSETLLMQRQSPGHEANSPLALIDGSTWRAMGEATALRFMRLVVADSDDAQRTSARWATYASDPSLAQKMDLVEEVMRQNPRLGPRLAVDILEAPGVAQDTLRNIRKICGRKNVLDVELVASIQLALAGVSAEASVAVLALIKEANPHVLRVTLPGRKWLAFVLMIPPYISEIRRVGTIDASTSALSLARALAFVHQTRMTWGPAWIMRFAATKSTLDSLNIDGVADLVKRASRLGPPLSLQDMVELQLNLDQLHEIEMGLPGSPDTVRADIAGAFCAGEVMMALTGSSRCIFASTFAVLLDRLEKTLGSQTLCEAFAQHFSPQAFNTPETSGKEEGAAQLLNNLAHFRRIDELYDGRNVFFPVVIRLVTRDPAAFMAFAPLFIRMALEGSPSDRESVNQLLIDQAKASTPGARGVLRWIFERDPGALSVPARAIASALPKIPATLPATSSWRRDGKAVLQSFFYPDESSIGRSYDFFISQGFKGTREAHGYLVRREKNGIVQEARATVVEHDKVPSQATSGSANVDYLAHRGHSTHRSQTFVGVGRARGMIVHDGSCGGYGAALDDGSSTSGHLFANIDRGRGATNDRLALALLDGIARNETTWEGFRLNGFAREGVVLPTDPVFVVMRYEALLNP